MKNTTSDFKTFGIEPFVYIIVENYEQSMLLIYAKRKMEFVFNTKSGAIMSVYEKELQEAEREMEALLESGRNELAKANGERQRMMSAETELTAAQEDLDRIKLTDGCSCIGERLRRRRNEALERAVTNLIEAATKQNKTYKSANTKLMKYKAAALRWKELKEKSLEKVSFEF